MTAKWKAVIGIALLSAGVASPVAVLAQTSTVGRERATAARAYASSADRRGTLSRAHATAADARAAATVDYNDWPLTGAASAGYNSHLRP